MRGIITTIIFLIILSGCSSVILGGVIVIPVLIEPNAYGPTELHWYTWTLMITYAIITLKIFVKLSRWISNSICNCLFGSEK